MIKNLCNIITGVLLSGWLLSGCHNDRQTEFGIGTIQMISPEHINVDGELLIRLMKNFDRLEETKYRPDSVFQSEEESGWWPGDMQGRTTLALVKMSRITKRTPLFLDSIFRLFPEKVNEKGYFGTIHPEGVVDEQQLASHGWVLRGLCEYYLWKKDAMALSNMNRVIDNLILPTAGFHRMYPNDPSKRKHDGKVIGTRVNEKVGNWILSTDIGCDFVFLDGVVQAYQVTGREELKPVIDEIIALYRSTDLVKIQAQLHSSLTGLRGILRYFEITGDSSLIQTVEDVFGKYRQKAWTENYENYNWFGRPEWTEPCAVIDSYIISLWLWRLTGKPEYAEYAQLIYYNAIAFEQRDNGGFGIDNCAGANSIFLHSNIYEAHWCCTMRGGEGLADAAQYSVFKDSRSIYLTSFGDAEFKIPFENDTLYLTENTNYPFKGQVNLEVKATNLSFIPRINLFVPSWIDDPQVYVNDKKAKTDLLNGFISFKAKLKKGDQISYTFKLKSGRKALENANGLQGYHRYFLGPLILGHVGKTEIKIPRDPQIIPMENGAIQLNDSSLQLVSVYHLLKPEVGKQKGFQLQVLFKNE